jgi:glutamate synthase (NADPH/NADH) large chain
MTGGVVAVLGKTGRNFAAGMSGGIAYVYDVEGKFEERCNQAMVALERIAPAGSGEDAGAPRRHSISAADSGMGDPLRFDAERLRILVERHHLYTGSARAREILDNWDVALTRFYKVMPTDYAKALADLGRERGGLRAVAAE